MNYILLIICLLVPIYEGMSQSLKFSEQRWNFGVIREDGGEVSHTFAFKNSLSTPVVITDITTSCGCTTPRYSKRPILPLEESTIEVVYDPMYRPGVFSRDLKIYTSADDEPIVLSIVGDATPRKRSVQESYPYIVGGGVRVSSLYGYLQHVSPGVPRQGSFNIINTSSQSRRVEVCSEFPTKYLSVDAPKVLAAGESGVINVTYDIPEGESFYGEMADDLLLYVEGVRSAMSIQVRAYGVDKFEDMTKKGGAKGDFTEKIVNFETFYEDKGSETKSLIIKNVGHEPLYIRSVGAPRGVVVNAPIKEPIAPGRSMKLEVRLDERGGELGDFVRYVTFILNDAENPVVRLKIIGRGER